MSDIKKFLDLEGVKAIWSKIGEDYPNNDTFINVINAIDEVKANKEDLVQSDWNQTDESKIDFIKNKPLETTSEEIIELLIAEDLLMTVTDSDGSFLSDENDNILLW